MSFSPPRVAISAITQALPCVVTTSSDHNLTTGQVVRIHVPKDYGMYPLDKKLFSVSVLSDTEFSLQYSQVPPAVEVDSRTYPAFTIPSNPRFTAEVLAVGSGPTYRTGIEWELVNNFCDSLVEDATQNIET